MTKKPDWVMSRIHMQKSVQNKPGGQKLHTSEKSGEYQLKTIKEQQNQTRPGARKRGVQALPLEDGAARATREATVASRVASSPPLRKTWSARS